MDETKIIKSTKSKRSLLVTILVIFSLIIVYQLTVGNSADTDKNKDILKSQIEPQVAIAHDEEFVVNFSNDVILALYNYYQASIDVQAGLEDVTDLMTTLMKRNTHLREGNNMVEKYQNDKDEVVNTVSKGMMAGASVIIKSNEDLIQFFRTANLNDSRTMQEMNYQIAKAINDRKEGFKLITISSPFIAGLLFEFAESENQKGKIPYKISDDNREKLIQEIDRLFLVQLKAEKVVNSIRKEGEREYNSILVAVDSIRNNLIYDNYEDVPLAQ
jgi:hypothetical protein